MGVDVVQGDAAGDHHHLDVVQQLGDLLGRRVLALVLGGHPDLGGFLDDLLADGMDPLVHQFGGAGGGGVAVGCLVLELGEQLLESLLGHGRAPAIATGLATSRRDLSVWVVTGDGDALSIGGNHLIHALRRNVNLKILLFNNRIYGLTKGQYSPTSEVGKITKSTPMGSLDAPFNPIFLALGAEASFVARTVDSDRKHLTEVLRQAAEHPGTALIEIYQNCNIFNDGAFDALKDKQQAEEAVIRLEHGQPIRFGTDNTKGVLRNPHTGDLDIVTVTADNEADILVHDAHATSPTTAFALSRLADPDTLHHTPIGVLRSVERPVYDTLMSEQLDTAVETDGKGDLAALLAGNDTWTVVG